jgi:hypothetical protein
MMVATRNAYNLASLRSSRVEDPKGVRIREGPDWAGDHPSIEDRPAKPRDQEGHNLRVQN